MLNYFLAGVLLIYAASLVLRLIDRVKEHRRVVAEHETWVKNVSEMKTMLNQVRTSKCSTCKGWGAPTGCAECGLNAMGG